MDGFMGEIRAFAFSYAPRNWVQCNGQLLPLNQYGALYAVLGTQYGGNGTTNFALPNLSGRATMSQGQGPGLSSYAVGQTSGVETYALLQSEMPMHNHLVHGKTPPQGGAGLTGTPSSTTYLSRLAATAGTPQVGYAKTLAPSTPLAGGTVGVSGGGLGHENRQPLLPLLFCICIQGLFPARG